MSTVTGNIDELKKEQKKDNENQTFLNDLSHRTLQEIRLAFSSTGQFFLSHEADERSPSSAELVQIR